MTINENAIAGRMRMRILRAGFMSTLLVFVLCLPAASVVAQSRQEKDAKPKPAKTISELKKQLEKILADWHTPGLSVAIVHRDGPEWIAGLGKSSVAMNRPLVTPTGLLVNGPATRFGPLAAS